MVPTDQCLVSATSLSSGELYRASPGRACLGGISERSSGDGASSSTPIAPCKSIAHLRANPGADVTRIPAAIDGTNNSDKPDGVECSEAYEMLIHFATTEAKLDTVALALENGCVANKGSGGGCRVRKEFVWKALDDLQN